MWETTYYTLDLNTGLTQVLSDGTTTYAYGLGRISQQSGTTPEYFLGDALGSVRQMTDQAGGITYARNYDPYGVVTYTGGTSQTEYGFTGEQYGDSTQLVYLRARYYNPADGRFQSRDTWSGDVMSPLSLNQWMYVEGNPVNLVDPTGHEPWWCRILGLNCPGPETDNYSEKMPPIGITWFPESDPLANGAVGIPQNTNAAQFLNSDYEPCDYYLGDCVHYGLCGAVALSAITGIPISSIARVYIWGKENGVIVTEDNPPDYTGPGTMTQIVNKLIGGGWSAEGNYWSNFTTRDNLPNQIYDWLSQRKFAIAGVTIMSGSSRPENADVAGKVGGGPGSPTHWVVVTGISKEWSWSQETAYVNDNSSWNWVRIYNPFDNQTEYYHWEDFMQAWDNAGGMTVVLTKGYEWYLYE